MKPRTADKRSFSDKFLRTRPKAPKGKRLEYLDADCRGLALRITDTGRKTFVMLGRFPRPDGSLVYTRRELGLYMATDARAPEMTLEAARDLADAWRKMLRQGKDPKVEARRARQAAERERAVTFGVVAQDFIDRYTPRLAKEKQAKTIITTEFIKRWKDWPIVDVGPADVSKAIRAIVTRGAPYQAHNAFGYLRRLFTWAIATGEYGLEASPVTRLRPVELIGNREARERVLHDDELRRVWRAAYAMGFPYGPLVHLLILTGQRVNEVAGMQWPEVDLDKRLWTIPAERMKGGRAHQVPLTETAAAILNALPDYKGGDAVFTTTAGEKSLNGFSKMKRRLDSWTAVVLAYDREQDDEIADGKPERWVLHDLRRTMRTHLSALPVQDMVRELVIAHAKPGLHKVYDQHAYLDEKRQCLELWEARLKGITAPPVPHGSNVVTLARARA